VGMFIRVNNEMQ